MDSEPLFKRLVLGWWRSKRTEERLKSSVEVAMEKVPDGAADLAEQFSVPFDLIQDLYMARKSESSFLDVLRHYRAKYHIQLSTEGARRVAEFLTANAEAQAAYIGLIRKAAERKDLSEALAHEEKMRKLDRQIETMDKEDAVRERQERRHPQPEARPDPLGRFHSKASSALGRLRGEAATRKAKIEIVNHLAAADIAAARAASDDELVAHLERARDDMIGDINTGEDRG